ncbi:MAG TPA: DUF167 domain-containing protein [Gemmatimonadales bacterium]|nr:DUF167 domain-containing protein [Gemmatimonadales bacterium]
MNPVETTSDGIRIQLHIQPRASRTELAGRFGEALKVRLKSPPVDGAANQELVRFIAEVLRVPRARVELLAGHTGRRKTVRVTGIGAKDAERRLGLAPG